MEAWRTLAGRWLADAAQVLVGGTCVGCANPALGLCPDCTRTIRPQPRVVREQPCRIAASGAYDGVLRSALLAWKERGRFTVERHLAHLLAASVLALEVDPPVALLPIPARADRRRARGADVIADLARCTAADLRAIGYEATAGSALGFVRSVRDQAGLTAADRSRNLRGSLAVRRRPTGPVVVVDDIVTTGATMAEAIRALREGQVRVLGAAVVAERRRS